MIGEAEALREIREIYASLPGIECQGLCGHDCKGIDLSPLENKQIRRRKGIGIPPPEKLMAIRGLGEFGIGNAICPLYDRIRGTCTVYDLRPIICRIYGVMEPLPCPHGCQPERMLTAKEGYLTQVRVNWLGGYLNEGEYQRMQSWAEDAEIFPIIEARMRNQVRQSQAEQKIQAILNAREAEKGNQ